MTDDEIEINIFVGFAVLLVLAMIVGFVCYAIADPIGALIVVAAILAIPLLFLLAYGIGTLVGKWGD